MCPKFEYKLQFLAICALFFLFDHYFITVSEKSTIYLHFLLCPSLFFAEFSLFIDISLSNLDTWGRVYFVHFFDILNTSPSVQIRVVNLKESRLMVNKKAARMSDFSFAIKTAK